MSRETEREREMKKRSGHGTCISMPTVSHGVVLHVATSILVYIAKRKLAQLNWIGVEGESGWKTKEGLKWAAVGPGHGVASDRSKGLLAIVYMEMLDASFFFGGNEKV